MAKLPKVSPIVESIPGREVFITVRATKGTQRALSSLAKALKVSQADVIESLVNQAYSKFKGQGK